MIKLATYFFFMISLNAFTTNSDDPMLPSSAIEDPDEYFAATMSMLDGASELPNSEVLGLVQLLTLCFADYLPALRLLAMATEHGHFGLEKSPLRARKWYEDAARLGCVESQEALERLPKLADGEEAVAFVTTVDDIRMPVTQVIADLTQRIPSGDHDAMNDLAEYFFNNGFLHQAHSYFTTLAANNYPLAAERLELLNELKVTDALVKKSEKELASMISNLNLDELDASRVLAAINEVDTLISSGDLGAKETKKFLLDYVEKRGIRSEQQLDYVEAVTMYSALYDHKHPSGRRLLPRLVAKISKTTEPLNDYFCGTILVVAELHRTTNTPASLKEAHRLYSVLIDNGHKGFSKQAGEILIAMHEMQIASPPTPLLKQDDKEETASLSTSPSRKIKQRQRKRERRRAKAKAAQNIDENAGVAQPEGGQNFSGNVHQEVEKNFSDIVQPEAERNFSDIAQTEAKQNFSELAERLKHLLVLIRFCKAALPSELQLSPNFWNELDDSSVSLLNKKISIAESILSLRNVKVDARGRIVMER